MSNTRNIAMLILCVLFTTACAGDDELPYFELDERDQRAQDTAQRVGTLLAEFKYPRSEELRTDLAIHAHFLDVRGVPLEVALDVLEIWTPEQDLALDSCTLKNGLASSTNGVGPQDVSLQLLDVGPIEVFGPEQRVALEARRLPDLLSAFSGVIYSSEHGYDISGSAIEYYPGARYRFSAPGRGTTGSFRAEMIAPEPLYIESLAYEDIQGASQVYLSYNDDVHVGWNREDEQSGYGDVYIDLSAGIGPDTPRLRCRTGDTGAFSIPSAIIDRFAKHSSVLELSVRRVHTKDIEMQGLDSTAFVIAASDVIEIILD